MIIRHDQLATAGFETLPFLSRVRANEYVSTPPLTKNEEALLRREKAILMARGCPADRKEEDKLLVYCRLIRLPYGDIIPLLRERSVESTIRGRVRNLIRTDDERARVQSWTRNDELLFNIKMFMHDASTNGTDKAKNVYNFKLIRDFIHGKGGNYFSAMAIKKQLIAVGRIAE
ncbi:hypothetical protein EDB81DRAFT_774595 [Dactylonectria macrodidyma]|uniref:Uncharacterized protein n=1 Tax=Dactylonectria macrodidyma TaxID=307937 RepID=A0A9P9JGZ4_9HYPO|nr:hypothetical protein EDB81DRAFT_774595 [Dactylonectria macrodidyma]